MNKTHKAFTLVELMIAVAISCIVIIAIRAVLSDGQRAWNKMYNDAYSDVVTASIVSGKKFDAVVRKSGSKKISVDPAGSWVEVQYYDSDDSSVLDRYARFYTDGDKLKLERGSLEPRAELSTEIICGNVANCVFCTSGKSAQMMLTLESNSQKIAVVSSAFMHN